MIAKILPILLLVVASHQANVELKTVEIEKPQIPNAPEETQLAPVAPPAQETPQEPAGPEMPLSGIDINKISCDPHGKIFLLLPHYSDCSKFFMCVHGEEVEFSCAPGGLYFDFPLQTCGWSWATKCVLRDHPDKDIEGSGEETFNWLTDHAENQSG